MWTEIFKIYFSLHIGLGLWFAKPIFDRLCKANPGIKVSWSPASAGIIFLVWPVLALDMALRRKQ